MLLAARLQPFYEVSAYRRMPLFTGNLLTTCSRVSTKTVPFAMPSGSACSPR